MAKVGNNMFLRGTSGKLGGQFVLRTLRDGRTVICNMPDFSKRKLSRDQKQHHKRFQEAAAYAKRAARSQPIYAQLAAGTMKNSYNVALGDWFHPPVIHLMERRDGRIMIDASDDVLVTKVVITILDNEGKVLEKGEGTRQEGPSTGSGWWEYVPQLEGKTVTVEAWDLPGHVTKLVL